MNKVHIIVGGSSLVSLAAGTAAGYFIATKKLEAKYAALADEEIAKAKEQYTRLNKMGRYETPLAAVEQLIPHVSGVTAQEAEMSQNTILAELIRDYDGSEPAPTQEALAKAYHNVATHDYSKDHYHDDIDNSIDVEDDPEEWENVDLAFQDDEDEDDYSGEEAHYIPQDRPYIISRDVYRQEDLGYEQQTLTYFEADETLVDNRNTTVDDINAVIGVGNLNHFGSRSGDRNIVHIRNERLQMDFEVLRHAGSFLEEVLGYTDVRENTLRAKKFSEHE